MKVASVAAARDARPLRRRHLTSAVQEGHRVRSRRRARPPCGRSSLRCRRTAPTTGLRSPTVPLTARTSTMVAADRSPS
jgi:hypothetical protein